jgi:hypothetical protein
LKKGNSGLSYSVRQGAGEDRHAAEDAEAEGEAEAAARRPGGDEEGGTKADGEDGRGQLEAGAGPED